MGYSLVGLPIECFSPSDDVIVSNDPVKNGTSSSVFKAVQLTSVIQANSLFRFKFEGALSGAGSANARIRRNGVNVGTNRSLGASYVPFVEDIAIQNWKTGDTVDVYVTFIVGGGTARIQNFRLCGVGSPFYATVT